MPTAISTVQTATPATDPRSRSVVARLAERFGMEPSAFQQTIIATCFPSGKPVTREQFAAFAIVADQYELNPVTKEIYAFPSKGGGIVPIVGVDGWARIINSHPMFDGMDFQDTIDTNGKLVAVNCVIFRKDRGHPTRITEYMDECFRNTDPWKSHPRRMLRHKAMIQCARVAFSFALYDPDEAERIVEAEVLEVQASAPAKARTLDELAASEPRVVQAAATVRPESSPAQAAAAAEQREAALAEPDDAAPEAQEDPDNPFAGWTDKYPKGDPEA